MSVVALAYKKIHTTWSCDFMLCIAKHILLIQINKNGKKKEIYD